MSEESKRGVTEEEEQRDPFPAFCQQLAKKMANCGGMMARCMEMMKPETPAADEPPQTDG
jgi:hypothetical protein